MIGPASSTDGASSAQRESGTLSLPRHKQPPLVLFLCQTNATSSILAEAILRHSASGRVRAASGGDRASAQVNPYTLECLKAHDIATVGLHSKPWGEFFGLFKPPVRILIMLSEVYAAEANWNHDSVRTVKAHWPLPDPGAIAGSELDRRLAFEEAFATLEVRIGQLLALPLDQMKDEALSRELARIGELD